MGSVVVQMDERDLERLRALGIAHKDVTERERLLKQTVERLKCELSGDGKRYYVVERVRYAALLRLRERVRSLPVAELAAGGPACEQALARLVEEARALPDGQPRKPADARSG